MNNSLVTIYSTKKQCAAEFIHEKLESEGIQCFCSYEIFEGRDGLLQHITKINIRSDRAEKAVQVLLEIHSAYDLDKITMNDIEKKDNRSCSSFG